MRAVVVEPEAGGHRFNFVRLLHEGLGAIGVEVALLTTNEAAQSSEFSVHLGQCSELRVVAEPIRGQGAWNVARWKAAALFRASVDYGTDYLFFPYADGLAPLIGGLKYCLPRLGASPKPPAEGILLRSGAIHSDRNALDRLKQRLALAGPWAALHHLDPYYVESARCLAGGRKISALPDPVTAPQVTWSDARARLGISTDAVCIGCVGTINARKGLDRLVRAFSLARRPANARLVFIGRLDDFVRHEIASVPVAARRAVYVVDEHVGDDLLDAGIAALDVVFTPYPHHTSSSSIILRAAAAGKPVVATQLGWMGRVVHAFDLGVTFTYRNSEDLVRKVEDALQGKVKLSRSERRERFVRYSSEKNFIAHMTTGIRRMMGMEASPDLMTWDEVSRWEVIGSDILTDSEPPRSTS